MVWVPCSTVILGDKSLEKADIVSKKSSGMIKLSLSFRLFSVRKSVTNQSTFDSCNAQKLTDLTHAENVKQLGCQRFPAQMGYQEYQLMGIASGYTIIDFDPRKLLFGILHRPGTRIGVNWTDTTDAHNALLGLRS